MWPALKAANPVVGEISRQAAVLKTFHLLFIDFVTGNSSLHILPLLRLSTTAQRRSRINTLGLMEMVTQRREFKDMLIFKYFTMIKN